MNKTLRTTSIQTSTIFIWLYQQPCKLNCQDIIGYTSRKQEIHYHTISSPLFFFSLGALFSDCKIIEMAIETFLTSLLYVWMIKGKTGKKELINSSL